MFKNLKAELKQLHITQKELADAIGCTPTTMLLKIKGEADWKLSEMRAAQKYINMMRLRFEKSQKERDMFFCPDTLEWLFAESDADQESDDKVI